jgi:hypothetical protein
MVQRPLGPDLFINNQGSGTVSEFSTSGAVVNASLVSGLNEPYEIAVVPEPSVV